MIGQLIHFHSEIHPLFIKKLFPPCNSIQPSFQCNQNAFYFNITKQFFICKFCSLFCKDNLVPLESIDLSPKQIVKRLSSEYQTQRLIKEVSNIVNRKIQAIQLLGDQVIIKLKDLGKEHSIDLQRILTQMNDQKKKISETRQRHQLVEAVKKLIQGSQSYFNALLQLNRGSFKQAQELVKQLQVSFANNYKFPEVNPIMQSDVTLIYDTVKNVLESILRLPEQFQREACRHLKKNIQDKYESVGVKLFQNFDITVQQYNRLSHLLKPIGFNFRKVKMLYNAKINGDSATQFHNRCDNIFNTLILIRANDRLFGGFVKSPWTSCQKGTFCPDQSAFLFSVNENLVFKQKIKNKGKAYFCHQIYGPIFGGGCDLVISNGCLSNFDSYSNLNHTFQCELDNAKKVLAGSEKFKVSNYIVLQIE